MSLVELFENVDDFCNIFEPRWASFQLANGLRQRKRATQMLLSEKMTIMSTFINLVTAFSKPITRTTFKSIWWKSILAHSLSLPLEGFSVHFSTFPNRNSEHKAMALSKSRITPEILANRANPSHNVAIFL